MKSENGIILFDGQCNFCDKSVQFILKRDFKEYFLFASLQSDIGQSLLQKYNLSTDCDSFVLIENNKAYTQSQAALNVCRNLHGLWKLLYVFTIIPKPIRDYVYRFIAQNRYKWWGQISSCGIPTKETRKRFLS